MKIHLHRVANMNTVKIDKILSIYTNTSYIEGDVRCTADGILVMSHDNDWFGYQIDQHSYVFLNQVHPLHSLPMFDDLIEYIKNTNIGLNIEIKTDSDLFYIYQNYIILKLCRQFSKLKENNIPIIQCFELNVLKTVSYFLSYFSFPCKLSWLIDDINIYNKFLNTMDSFVSYAPSVTIISPNINLIIDERQVKDIQSNGYEILPWYNKKYSSEKSKLFESVDGMIFDI